jgi:hypothetical protein
VLQGSVAVAAPDERNGQTDRGIQASHFDVGSLQGGERAREDGRSEASCGERAQEEWVAALQGEGQRLAGVAEQLVQHGGDGRAAARRDERVSAEIGDAHLSSRWCAVGSERGDHFLVSQSLDGELVGDLAGQEAEGGVKLVGGEQAEHVGGDALTETDLDAGVGAAEAGEQPGDVEVAGGQKWSDPDAPAHDAPKLVDLFARGIDLGEDTPGSRGDGVACLGGGDAAARALEQRGAQFLLEPSDLVRERRLGEVELRRGAREMAVPRHRLNASQLPKLHANDRKTRLRR